MTKHEFLEILQRTLARELDAREVADNVRYYSEYIENAVRGGKSEAQVLAELGDPRMIARTILDVGQQRSSEDLYHDDTVYTETEDGAYDGEDDYGDGGGFHFHVFRGDGPHDFHMVTAGWKAWLIFALILIALCMLLGTTFVILWKLLPIVLAVSAAVWIFRWLTGRQ